MPLLMLCGHPSAGLSSRAGEINDYFQQKIKASPGCGLEQVVVVNDATAHITKDMYNERNAEKMARESIMGHVRRHLNHRTLVVVDNMCYIKGFRYQFFCEARSAKTTCCVVYVGTPKETCRAFNAMNKTPWPADLFEALLFRFEEPNSMTRWDSPLFILAPNDKLPGEDLWDCLVVRKPMKQNEATSIKPTAAADYLTTLNDTTGAIIKEAMELCKMAPGAQVKLAGQQVQLPYSLTSAQLARLRRNFIQLNRSTPLNPERITPFFLEYLTQNWTIQ